MINQKKRFPLYVISGPSGSGKTSICRKIADDLGWYYSISFTTRSQREGEIDGRDYYFVSKEKFLELKEQGEFLEWAQVYDNYYGTSQKIIQERLDSGQGVILDVDTQGALNIKKIMPDAVLVFIKTHDLEELKHRLFVRGRDSQQEIERRINRVREELKHTSNYDYVVVNDNLEWAVAEIKSIIEK